MKKLLKIVLTIVLTVVMLPAATVSADALEQGFYAVDLIQEAIGDNINNYNVADENVVKSSNINLVCGEYHYYQFFYYDGSNFTRIDNPAIPEGITCNVIEEDGFKAIELFTDQEFTNKTITHSTFSISVSATLPDIAIYSANQATVANLVDNVTGKNKDSLYLISRSKTITSVSFDGYEDNYVAKTNTESVDYDAQTNKLTLSDVNFGFSFKLKIFFSDQNEHILMVDSFYDLGTYTYQGTEYSFGLMDADEENNLHITGGHDFDTNEEEDIVWTHYLVAGDLYAASAQAAPEAIYDGISNVQCSVLTSTFEEGALSIEVGSEKQLAYERDCYPVTLTFKKGKAGVATVKVNFDLTIGGTTTNISTYHTYTATRRMTVSVDLNANDMAVSNFNNIFSSYENLVNALKAEPYNKTDVEDANSIVINLPEGSYSGNYEVNIAKNQEQVRFSLVGAENTDENGNWSSTPEHMQTNKTEIKGSLHIKGGMFSIEKIDFTGDDNNKITVASKVGSPIVETASKVGLYASNETNKDEMLTPAVDVVRSCNFKNLDYAVLSTDSGVVCDVHCSTFEDCNYGYYMDARGKQTCYGGSGSQNNLFLNCDNSVSFISISQNDVAYSFRFVNNYFINSGTTVDFNMAESGTYYFTKNYYGKTLTDLSQETNNRTVSVYMNDAEDIEVITNPCIRYPGSEYYLGIDPEDGLLLRIFNDGNPVMINSKDIGNISSIGIASSDGQEFLGEIVIGGNK